MLDFGSWHLAIVATHFAPHVVLVGYIFHAVAAIETAQIDECVNAVDASTVAKLPQYPLGAIVEAWLTLGISRYE